jgi:hypothetical protein
MASSLYLYSTAGCHLCEQAEALLQPLLRAGLLHLQVVEISHDDTLVRRYGVRIPVLAGVDGKGEWQELGWPFDEAQVRVQAQVWSWSSQASLMCQGS